MKKSVSPDRVQALCCHCGTLRTMKSTYRGRLLPDVAWFENNNSIVQLRRMQGRGHATEIELYWRALVGLKCQTCDQWTRHALLREEKYASYCEDSQHELDELLAQARVELRTVGSLEHREFVSPARVLDLRQLELDGSWAFAVRQDLSAAHEIKVLSWATAAVAGELDDSPWRRTVHGRSLVLDAGCDFLAELVARRQLAQESAGRSF